MKAEITENGTLIVSPENGTEAYALGKWSDGRPIINDVLVDLDSWRQTNG